MTPPKQQDLEETVKRLQARVDQMDKDIFPAFTNIERTLKSLNTSVSDLTKAAIGEPEKGILGVFTKVHFMWKWWNIVIVGFCTLILGATGFLAAWLFGLITGAAS